MSHSKAILAVGTILLLNACNPLSGEGGANFAAGHHPGFAAEVPTPDPTPDPVGLPTLSYAASTGRTGMRGTAMSVTPSTLTAGDAGATISSCVVAGSLPSGLSLNSTTCVITGTPAAAVASTAFTITVTNSDAKSASASVTLDIAEKWSDTDNSVYGFGATDTIYRGANFVSDRVTLANNGGCNGAVSNCAELSASWTPRWNQLTAYWKLNEASWNGTAGEAVDSRGTYHGARRGSGNTTADARVGNRAGNGTVAGGMRAGDLAFTNGAPKLTFSMWYKFTTLADDYSLFSKIGGGNSDRINLALGGASSGSNNTRLVAYLGNGADAGVVSTTDLLATGTWYHVAWVFDGSLAGNTNRLKIYVDGELLTTTSLNGNTIAATTPSNTGSLIFGQAVGSYDDIAVWTDALSASDLKAIYRKQIVKRSGSFDSRVFDARTLAPTTGLEWKTSLPFGKELPDSGLSEDSSDYSAVNGSLMNQVIALWHLNGSSAVDSSGNLHHGTPTGGVTFNGAGKFNTAVSFDGTNSYLSFGDIAGNLAAITVSGWVKGQPGDQPTYSGVIAKGVDSSNSSSWNFWIDRGAAKFNWEADAGGVGSQTVEVAVGTVLDGTWHHIAGTYNGSTSIMYVDGVAVGSKSLTGIINDSGQPVQIGRYNSNSRFFVGSVDEVGIWGRAMDATEVQQLYRRGVNRVLVQSRFCASAGCADDARWFGPAGDSQGNSAPFVSNSNVSYFSELLNQLSGLVLPDAPSFDYLSFGSITLPAARYVQYRVTLESDDLGAGCSGAACLPDLQTFSIKP